MKLHLPIVLLSLLSVASLAQAVEIPDDYEVVEIHSISDLNPYKSNTADKKYAFLIDDDLIFPSSTVINGGHFIFSTKDGEDLAVISFTNGTNPVFEQSSNLDFDSLEQLSISKIEGQKDGGAICLSSNGKINIVNVDDNVAETNDIIFVNNKVSENEVSRSDARGGAIFADSSSINISHNGDVYFFKNSASQSYNGYDAAGGAIYSHKTDVCIEYNDSLNFDSNYVSCYNTLNQEVGDGGAIYSSYGNIEIKNNTIISFSSNYASSLGYDNNYARGGAIYSFYSDVDIQKNDIICFEKNSVHADNCAEGGALYFSGTEANITNNGTLIFSENRAEGRLARGGAIYYEQNGGIYFKKNQSIQFSNNACIGDGASGGAITLFFDTSSISFIKNEELTFNGNFCIANGSRGGASGGAISGRGNIDISNNHTVTFCCNYTDSKYDCSGGAIYSNGSISIVGNDNVVFEKNYEKVGSSYKYQLRSIYFSPLYSTSQFVLSAKTGGYITFNDSIYVGKGLTEISFNNTYRDANGRKQQATGDIVFSGKYTEEHLKEVKGGIAGTSTEIANSRTSELLNTVNLYGGTLRVEDKAVLKTHAINIVADGNATMKVLDAEVNASTYDVTINSTGQLTLGGTTGSAKLTAKNININAGATLAVERIEPVDPSSVITLAASETVSIFNEKLGGVASGNLNLAAGSSYKADGAHLGVINGTLTFNATDGEKINLILTLGAEYNKDSQVILFTDVTTVNFVWDDIIASDVSDVITLNASDYFTGDWINENTSLIYDSGTIYVTGVNRVIPEPTTATLSLLALAGLVARRRRK